MLRTWNAENINQLGPSQRSGGKSFKALGDAGSSENPPPPSGKGMLQQQQQQYRKPAPLGGYSENPPPSASKGKTGGGLGLSLRPPNSSSKPQQQKQQRRALGDISNAGKGPPGAGGGGSHNNSSSSSSSISGPSKAKQLTPGLKFPVHSDSSKVSGAGAAGAKARGGSSSTSTKARVGVKGRVGFRTDGNVEDVEAVLGRTGDEEEVLVERRFEEREARKYSRPFRTTSTARSNRSRSRSTSSAFPRSSSSSSSSSSSRPKSHFGRDITNTAVVEEAIVGSALLDKSLDSAIDRICHRDLEDGKMALKSGDEGKGGLAFLEDDSDVDMDMDSLTLALEGIDSEEPLGLVGDGFLTEDVDLSFV